MKLWKQWSAGFVRRWHSNTDLCHTIDPTDGHSARVIKLALMIKPDLSRDAIIYALHHDDGESGLGDISGEWKRYAPALAAALDACETVNKQAMGLTLPEISDDELKVVDVADKLDAYLWMIHHRRRDLEHREDWGQMRERLVESLSAYHLHLHDFF